MGSLIAAAALTVGLMAPAMQASAAVAAVYGSLGNFDVINHTGKDAYGFEIQIEGVPSNYTTYAFSGERYGAPKFVPYATGVNVRWDSPTLATKTIPYAGGGAFGGTCYMGYSASYDAAGCEHFGVALSLAGTSTYRWLVEDPANPGTLIPSDPSTPVATPYYYIAPPVIQGAAPVLVVEVQAPEPAEAPERYGDAQWIRTFVSQVNRVVTLDELLSNNIIVPQDPTQVETAWDVIQAEPAALAAGNGKHTRSRKRNQGSLKPDTRSVVRRIELYAYTGAYDPVTHLALCADTTCTAPSADELGDLDSAQMTAALVQQNNITVSKNGTGTVSSADNLISCGSKCVAAYEAGTVVTLTAAAASGSVFRGWSGACTNAAGPCVTGVTGGVTVSANFAKNAVLSAKTSGGAGLVVSNPAGINCGSGGNSCNTTALTGSLFTLTAAPSPGFRFVGWSGGCTGVGSCNVVLNSNTTVQGNFAK